MVGVFALCFGPVLLKGKSLLLLDSFAYSYPLRTVAWEMLRHGEWPLWTPLMLSGYPLFAMTQISLGYPLTWGYFFLPGHLAEEVYVLAPFLLTPAFTYAYVRELGRSRLAALMAGLAFGYGGLMTNAMASNSIMLHAVMWLPLMLIAVERARRAPFVRCLLWATGAFALSVLTRHAQGFLYAGALAVAYGLFLSLVSGLSTRRSDSADRRAWFHWTHWRPLAVVCGALLFAAGLSAFQLLETMRVLRRSVRSRLSYEYFVNGSFTPGEFWRSLVAPAFHPVDVTAYMPPLVVALALVAVGVAFAGARPREPRVFFWLGVALVACVLMLGGSTPVARLMYRLPLVSLFRRPTRHAFEWTFALAILAAYGWDIVAARMAHRRTTHDGRLVVVGLCALVAAALVGALWWARICPSRNGPDNPLLCDLTESAYLYWKLAFTLLTSLCVWVGWRMARGRWRTMLLGGAIVLVCFVESLLLLSAWWLYWTKPPGRIATFSPVTRYLQQFPPAANRAYIRIGLFIDESAERPRVDEPNLTVLAGVHNVAGYEPLVLERYSRALGNVGQDAVNPRADAPGGPDQTLFARRSHVLDLLNTTHVVTFAQFATGPEALLTREGINFKHADLGGGLQPGETATLVGAGATGDTLALVTSLAVSPDVPDGQTVARLRISTSEGQTIERELQAGRDTAEWAHERPDVRAGIKHRLAPVFDSLPGDAANSFPAHRYWTRLALGAHVKLERIEITSVTRQAVIALWKATLYDAAQGQGTPLALPPQDFDPARWTLGFKHEDLYVWQNQRALPRAWLVAEAEAVDGEVALRRIRGEGPHEFDPRRTALLEVRPDELPPLPGGALAPESTAKVVSYAANHLAIETSAPTPTVLMVSEIFYPGWAATVDGQPARISLADFLLRGVALPAGQHRVEMHYVAPAARIGALVSAFTLLLLGALALYARRSRHAEPAMNNSDNALNPTP